MNDEDFLRLITLYLEDAITGVDLEVLNRELANSPDRVRQFNDLRQASLAMVRSKRPFWSQKPKRHVFGKIVFFSYLSRCYPRMLMPRNRRIFFLV